MADRESILHWLRSATWREISPWTVKIVDRLVSEGRARWLSPEKKRAQITAKGTASLKGTDERA
jgi:hypothetical protein